MVSRVIACDGGRGGGQVVGGGWKGDGFFIYPLLI